mgnify:CR=1 FL=1
MKRFKFCPKCGGKLANKKVLGRSRLVCENCNFIFYQDPKPTVGVFIVDNNKVLLAKRAVAPFKGWWDSIGGFMEEGETPQETAVRETKEETGLDVELIDILGVGRDKYEEQYTVPIAFLGKIVDGKPKPADDVEELEWFPLDDLPKNISFAGNKKALAILKGKFKLN